MKTLLVFFVGAMVGMGAFVAWQRNPFAVAVERADIQDRIVIDTPGKKEEGAPTQVVFRHGRHADVSTCETCHPPLEQRLNAAGNTLLNVHKVCANCHKPGGSADKVSSCNSCHTVKSG